MSKEKENTVGRPKSDDKAIPTTIYTKTSIVKSNGGKKQYRKKLKRLADTHLNKTNTDGQADTTEE